METRIFGKTGLRAYKDSEEKIGKSISKRRKILAQWR